MIITRRHRNHGFASKHTALCHQHRNAAVRRAVIAELAVVVVSPSRHRAVRAQGKAVLISRRHGNHGFARQHSTLLHQNRNVALGNAGAEIAGVVVSPSRHRPVRAQG